METLILVPDPERKEDKCLKGAGEDRNEFSYRFINGVLIIRAKFVREIRDGCIGIGLYARFRRRRAQSDGICFRLRFETFQTTAQ